MENNIKDNDKELFFTALNNFLEKENGIKGTKIFTKLRKIPQVLNKNIPWINSGINAYNDSFNKKFAKLEPIIKQESQNCFSIRFIIQNKKFTYDFEDLEKQISKLEGKSLDEYVSKKVSELRLDDFVDDINFCLDEEWSNDINDNCIKSVKKEFKTKSNEFFKEYDILMDIVGYKEKKEFETKLNEFLKENEDMLSKNHVFFRNSLQAVPHIINVVIPIVNEKIDEYNNDFDGLFLPLTPIVNKNSQNSFTINFIAQNKQVTYDFDEMYNKLVNCKGNYELESNMAKELGLYEFVTSIEDELYTEWDKAEEQRYNNTLESPEL